jgi:hypothetical protein
MHPAKPPSGHPPVSMELAWTGALDEMHIMGDDDDDNAMKGYLHNRFPAPKHVPHQNTRLRKTLLLINK